MKPIVWISLMILVACYVSGPVADPDLWWHIAIGRWIVAHQELPVVDHWNMFGVSTPWRAYSWLFEVVVALLDKAFGDRGLVVAQSVLLGLICAVVSACYRSISKSWFQGAFLGIIVTVATAEHYSLRPQSIIWALQAIVLAVSFSIVDHGLSRKRLLALAATMCLWANLHITTAIGMGVIGAVIIGAVPVYTSVVVLAVAFAGTLLTPYLGTEWIIFFSKTGHPLEFRSISEFQPATIMQFPTVFLVLMGAMVAVACTSVARKLPPMLLLGSGVLVMGGLAVIKFLPMAVILLGAVVARALSHAEHSDLSHVESLTPWERLVEGLRRLEWLWNKIPREGLAFLLLVLAWIYFLPLWREPIAKSFVPVDFADRILNEKLPHPVLNDFGRGGYFMYRYSDSRGIPAHLVPVDGRTNAVPAENLDQYMKMSSGAEDWHVFFDAVDPRTVVFQSDSPLISILKATGNWCVIGRNTGERRGSVLMVRKDEFLSRKQGGAVIEAENCA